MLSQHQRKTKKLIQDSLSSALTWFMLVLSYSSWTALSCRILCRKAGGWWTSMGAAVWLAGSRTASSKYSSLVGHITKHPTWLCAMTASNWSVKENISNMLYHTVLILVATNKRETQGHGISSCLEKKTTTKYHFCLCLFWYIVASFWKCSDSNNSVRKTLASRAITFYQHRPQFCQ